MSDQTDLAVASDLLEQNGFVELAGALRSLSEGRYVVFEWDTYYPSGAVTDETGRYPTVEEAASRLSGYDYSAIMDRLTGRWVDAREYGRVVDS